MFRAYYRNLCYILLLALFAPESAIAEMPVLGARSEAKADWIREWMGVKGKAIVTCPEIENPARALTMRGIVAKAQVFPLDILDILVPPPDGATSTNETNQAKTMALLKNLTKRSKEDIEGLLNDIRTISVTLPKSCMEAAMGRINQAPPVYSKARRKEQAEFADEEPVGLIVEERPRVVLRDRINWNIPPGPGANLRIRDVIQHGDQLELEFRNRESSEQYRFRMLIPTLSSKNRNIGLDIAGQFRRDEATFVWKGETEASARRRCDELTALGRFYIGDTGNFLALGQRLAKIDLSNSADFDDDWEELDGLYPELMARISWRYDPGDYDPDTLFAPGYGAEITFRLANRHLGAPVSYGILQANYRRTVLLADDLFWDMELLGYIGENVPHIMLPTMGGNDTVRGHSAVMSADRMTCFQQTLRRSFQWRNDMVFTPSILFDIGWASQKSLDNKRRDGRIEGAGTGIRWDFPTFYGFKMFETTFSRGFERDSGWKAHVRTRFEF